jgi:hypothetical protein
MLGASALVGPAAPAAAPAPTPVADGPTQPPVATRAPAPKPQATMLGMAAAQPPAASPAQRAAAAAPAAPGGSAPVTSAAPAKPAPQRTILGLFGAPKAAAKPAKAIIPATSDRTILGMSAASAPGAPAALGDPSEDAYDDESVAGLPGAGRSGGLGRTLALVGAGLVLGVGALFALKPGAPALEVQVSHEASGETLVVGVPGAEAGTRVRFAGSERPVASGAARFPLAPEALKLGANELAITVLGADGEARESRVAIEVDYRARFALDGLVAPAPHVDLFIETTPGAKVSIEGKPVSLDASGRAQAPLPVPAVREGSHTLRARYRVEAEGKPAVDGQLEASLPAASLVVESPSEGLRFEAPQLVIAGSAGSGAKVTVGGAEVPLTDGRFRKVLRMPEIGPMVLEVVARAPGQAPRQVTLHTERVASLALAAAAFTPDPGVTYRVLAADPGAQRGKTVGFDARVYNVETQGGKGVLQVLVGDCPKGERCPLWVETGELEAARKDDEVRILGTVLGEQQFRSKQGAVQAVPSVRAEFVLPRPRR